MKGLIFTEFLEMVETVWSLDMVDQIIARSQVASAGVYTSVGNYPHQEMVALVVALSEDTQTPVEQLIRTFGRHLFGRFAALYPRFFNGISDSFQFLGGIEDIIHAEVRKLYPEADLPTFIVETAPGRLTLTYFSEHPFADLAHGLIEGCLTHFDDKADLQREPAPRVPGAQARFVLTRQA
jgi:hypothetical protein